MLTRSLSLGRLEQSGEERSEASQAASLPQGCCYVVGPSEICEGRGLFASRDLPAGTAVTRYPGELVDEASPASRTRGAKRRRSRAQDYAYDLGNGWTLEADPTSDGATSGGGGDAHLANDALHVEVTGRENNCELREEPKGSRCVYLFTTRAVRRGEELLTSYLLPYWIARAERDALPMETRLWLRAHAEAQRVIRRASGDRGAEIEEYLGFPVAAGAEEEEDADAEDADAEDDNDEYEGGPEYVVAFPKGAPRGCACPARKSRARRVLIRKRKGQEEDAPQQHPSFVVFCAMCTRRIGSCPCV